jgi:hypothetical protein
MTTDLNDFEKRFGRQRSRQWTVSNPRIYKTRLLAVIFPLLPSPSCGSSLLSCRGLRVEPCELSLKSPSSDKSSEKHYKRDAEEGEKRNEKTIDVSIEHSSVYRLRVASLAQRERDRTETDGTDM